MAKKTTLWQNDVMRASRQVQQLECLYKVSQVLAAGARQQETLAGVLAILDKELGLNRGTITLLAPEGNEIRIEAVHDLPQEQSRRITYRIGEGVTGKVMETGKAMIVPKVSQESLFLNRFERWNVTKQELSFICVPIVIDNQVIGTISVDRPFEPAAPLDEEMRVLSIVASMIAHDLRARRERVSGRQELEEEIVRLRRELEQRFRPDNIIGNSNAMRDVYQQIRQAADSEGTVLIRGEPGAGKEVVARAIGVGSLKERTNMLERDLIVDALKRCSGNLAATARDLNTTARVIRYKVKELGIDCKQYGGKKG
jgi:Nif-specific regulatory protein